MREKDRFSQFNKLYPRKYGHNAFYIRVRSDLTFRVYKVAHLFSCVGVAYILEFFVSYRDLRKLRKQPFSSEINSFGIDCSLEEGMRIVDELKKKGYCSLEKYFKEDK